MTTFWCYVVLGFIFTGSTLAWDYMIERVENIKKPYKGHIIFEVAGERVNETDFAFTGNVTFRSPFSRYPNTYFHSVNFNVSPTGDHHHDRIPIRFPRITHCEFMNTNYRNYMVRTYKPHPQSHFPEPEAATEELCNGFRADHDVVFYIHKFVIDKSVEPPYVPGGFMTIEVRFELDESLTAGIILVARLENDHSWRDIYV